MVPAGGFVEYALIGYLKGDGNAGYAKFEGNTPALNNINKGIWQQIWYNDSTHTLKYLGGALDRIPSYILAFACACKHRACSK